LPARTGSRPARHSYVGIEDKVVGEIVRWIKGDRAEMRGAARRLSSTDRNERGPDSGD
jgi:hypothetical protein